MGRLDSPLHGRLLFLVGARRSGTNWLQRILGAHPSVLNVPSETYLFSRGLSTVAERVQHASIGSWQLGKVYMEREDFLDAMRDFCDRVFGSVLESLGDGQRHLLERTPEHAHALGLIRDVYPDARVIHIIRDGRDVTRSLLSMPWGPTTAAEAAQEWVDTVTAARRGGAGWDHYREVRYESLLATTDEQIRDLYTWLGLDASEATVSAALQEADVRYNVDPRHPETTAGKWRSLLGEADRTACEAVAGPLLRSLGYATSVDERPSPSGAEATPPASKGRPRRRGLGRLRLAAARRPSKRGLAASADPHGIQIVVDRFLAAVVERRLDEVRGMLLPGASVRLVDGPSDIGGRDSRDHDRFVEALIGDVALVAPATRSDVHPSLPRFTVVRTHRLPDGDEAHRVLVIGVSGEGIDHLTCYQLPASSSD